MSTIKSQLISLYQMTKADGVGCIQFEPTISELGYLESSLFEFFSQLPLSVYAPIGIDLARSEKSNHVFSLIDKTIFSRILPNGKLLYAHTHEKEINVAKYYSSLALIGNKI